MASKIFGAIGVDGGSTGYLDSIVRADLSDGDIAIVVDNTEETYVYRYESSSSAAESIPQVVKPANDAGQDGRWILTDMSIEDLKAYGNAVIDGTLTQTGLATFTTGVDITGYLRFDGAGVQLDAIKDEDDLVSDSATAIATQQSIKAYVDAQVAGIVIDNLAGLTSRAKFTWKDADEIYIGPCRYHHNGTSEQILKADANLTFQFGSAGSNANSDDVDDAALTLHYIYIDDTAVVAAGNATLTAAHFYNSITAPQWDADQLAWYGIGGGGADNTDTKDRCIGAFWANASNQLEEFYHDGGREMNYMSTASFENFDFSYPNTDFSQTVTLSAPAFCTLVKCIIRGIPSGNTDAYFIYARPTGSSATVGQLVGFASESDQRTRTSFMTCGIVCNSSQSIDIKVDEADASARVEVFTVGYYFPKGM